jgi:hypothetical protein
LGFRRRLPTVVKGLVEFESGQLGKATAPDGRSRGVRCDLSSHEATSWGDGETDGAKWDLAGSGQCHKCGWGERTTDRTNAIPPAEKLSSTSHTRAEKQISSVIQLAHPPVDTQASRTIYTSAAVLFPRSLHCLLHARLGSFDGPHLRRREGLWRTVKLTRPFDLAGTTMMISGSTAVHAQAYNTSNILDDL